MTESQKEKLNGYKQTDVGIIPEDWDVNLIEEISEVKSGKRLPLGKTLVETATSHPYIRVADMFWGGVSTEELKFVPDEVFPSIKNYRIYKEDIFISVAGTLGLVGKIPQELDGANLTENANKLTSIKCNRDFLLYLLMSPLIQNAIESARTLGAQPKLALVRIRNFQIPLPPLPEQQAIAEVLSDVDALVTFLDQLITKKRNIKQGAMQLLLTGKKRLPGFSGDWETKTLGEIADATAGGTPNTQISSYWNGNIRWMSSGELNLKIVYEVAGRITELGLKNSSTKIIPPNCILVGLAGQGKTRGTVAINKIELCTNQSIAAIYPSKLYVSEFLYHNLDNRYEELRSLSAGDSGRGGLNLTIIKKMEILLPPTIEEQKAIAQILSEMDAEIEALEIQQAKYKAVKQGMMQELLTGKTRLPIEQKI